MRNPLWILDFRENSSSAKFFETWWNAYIKNSTEKVHPDNKWFYVTDCPGKTFENILDDAGHLTLRRDDREPLIPLFNELDNDKAVLNVVFLGDITDEKNTHKCFHFWAARLRHALLNDKTQWTTVRRVHFYAMLWRPNTAAIAPGVSKQTRGFLQELNVLMNQDVNHTPFRSVVFVESPEAMTEKNAAFERMNLAALFLSSDDFIGDKQNHRFLDLSATGVYFEGSVQAQQGEFILSSSLVECLTDSRDPLFYNETAAHDFVESDQDTLSTFESKSIVESLKADTPILSVKNYAFDIKPSISPWSFKLRQVWVEYFCDFIPNYKKNLVNRVKRGLKTFSRDYKEKLYSNQKETITSLAASLQKQVFSIFIDPNASKYVGLQQAKKILSEYKQRIQDSSDYSIDSKIQAFVIPDELKNAAKQAMAEQRKPQDAIDLLEHKISHHPVLILSLLFRSLVLGFILGYLSWLLLPSMINYEAAIACTVGIGILPFVVGVVGQRARRTRIESIKQQYVGVMINCCHEELKDEIDKCLKTTYRELIEYCDWLQNNKLEFLREHLSVLSPADFSFEESPVLQPLVKSGQAISGNNDNLLLIPPVSVDNISDGQLTGSFGRSPLLSFDKDAPMHKVNIDGVNKGLHLVMRNKELMRSLIVDLMKAKANIKQSIEREVSFSSSDIKGKTLLLLDISGSMDGTPLEDLKKAVHSLEENYDVEWIAFNDNVVASSYSEGANIDALCSSGGTNFIPPLLIAVEKVHEELYDDVILISDGCPFESVEDILAVALQLQQPLNTISIGTSGADVMKDLSDKTSGVQIIVEDVKEIIRWEGKLQTDLQLGETGDFTFGQLLAKCHIPGCANALRSFVRSRMPADQVSLNSLIANYPGPGLAEWARITKKGSSLTQTAQVLAEDYRLGISESAKGDNDFIEKVKEHLSRPNTVIHEGPFMLAILLNVKGVALQNFAWAGLEENCSDLNDREQLQSLLEEGCEITNIYNMKI